MPGVLFPNNQAFPVMIARMDQRLRALETQQQSILTNLQGQPIISFGLQPGSDPAEWGIGLLHKAFGSYLGFLGEDANGNVAMKFFDAGGNLRLQIDAAGLHQYNSSGNELVKLDETGLHVYDASGTEQVLAGVINASPAMYGLAVLPQSGGELQQVGGFLTVSPDDVTSVDSNGTWISPGGTNSLTVDIGPSGAAVVTVVAEIATGGDNVEGFVGVELNGATPTGGLVTSAGASGGVNIVSGVSNVWGCNANASNTFALKVKTSGATSTETVNFYALSLTIQPL